MDGQRDPFRTNALTFEGEADQGRGRGQGRRRCRQSARSSAASWAAASGAAKGAAIGGAAGAGTVLATRGRGRRARRGRGTERDAGVAVQRPRRSQVTTSHGVSGRVGCRRSCGRLARREPNLRVRAVAERLSRRRAAPAQRDRPPIDRILRAIPVDDPHVLALDDVGTVLPQSDRHHGIPHGNCAGLRPMPTMLHAKMTLSPRRRASAISSSSSAPGLIQISGIRFCSNSSSSVSADVRLHVDRRHVDRSGHVEHRGVRLHALDVVLVRIDRNDRVSFGLKRPQRLVAELVSVVGGADDGDGHGHAAIIAAYNRCRCASRRCTTLLLLCFFTFFLGLGSQAITDADEAYYAEASREMVESGDWLTPRFNYQNRWEKPVLYYWLTAATYLATGPTEFAARFWSALSGVGLVLLAWAIARQITGPLDVAWLAGAIVATSVRLLRDGAVGAARPAAHLLHHARNLGRDARRRLGRHTAVDCAGGCSPGSAPDSAF